MAKIKRKKLERGVKLVKEHVYTPLATAVADLNSSGLDAEQLECQWAPFRINLSVPYMGEDSPGGMWATGFVLPPLQDTMSLSTTTQLYTDLLGNEVPYYVTKPDVIDTASPIFLDEVSLSFDQRDAPGAVASPWYDSVTGGSEHQGKISFDELALCDLRVAIVEREPLFFTPVQDRARASLTPTREVWSADIPHTQFGNDVFNAMPFVSSGINQMIDQWKSYAVSVSFPGVVPAELHSSGSANKNPVFPSVEISLKFRSKIRKRNTRTTWAPENAPTASLAKRTRTAASKEVSHSAPADGDKITADTAQGVNINIASVDEAFRQGVYAGFSEDSAAGQTIDAVAEELEPDSCYEVLTVPLFQNSHAGGWSVGNSLFHPYATGESSVNDRALIDRRIIPISYPMQIEHVVVALNFTPFKAGYGEGGAAATADGTFHPSAFNPSSSQQWEYEFGVGVGTGLHADEFEYAQVAHGTFKPGAMLNTTGGANNVIDRMMVGSPSALPLSGTVYQRAPNCELWCLPLSTVGGASATGSAYLFNEGVTGHVGTQGVPIFTGRAWTQTETRTDALANVSGREQWIEVRGKIDRIVSSWGSLADGHLLVGYQGFFVYIIGRKFLSS